MKRQGVASHMELGSAAMSSEKLEAFLEANRKDISGLSSEFEQYDCDSDSEM